jgi:hypothetical protein
MHSLHDHIIARMTKLFNNEIEQEPSINRKTLILALPVNLSVLAIEKANITNADVGVELDLTSHYRPCAEHSIRMRKVGRGGGRLTAKLLTQTLQGYVFLASTIVLYPLSKRGISLISPIY